MLLGFWVQIAQFPDYQITKCCSAGCRHLTVPKLPLTISLMSLSIKHLVGYSQPAGREPPVIKLDIINEVVNKTGITKTKAELAVETVFESMRRSLAKGDRIELRGFGVFNVRPRKTGIGRNPRTGAEVSIPPGKAVRFKPGKELQSID